MNGCLTSTQTQCHHNVAWRQCVYAVREHVFGTGKCFCYSFSYQWSFLRHTTLKARKIRLTQKRACLFVCFALLSSHSPTVCLSRRRHDEPHTIIYKLSAGTGYVFVSIVPKAKCEWIMLFGCSDDNNTEIEINKQIESSRSVPFRSVQWCVLFLWPSISKAFQLLSVDKKSSAKPLYNIIISTVYLPSTEIEAVKQCVVVAFFSSNRPNYQCDYCMQRHFNGTIVLYCVIWFIVGVFFFLSRSFIRVCVWCWAWLILIWCCFFSFLK